MNRGAILRIFKLLFNRDYQINYLALFNVQVEQQEDPIPQG